MMFELSKDKYYFNYLYVIVPPHPRPHPFHGCLLMQESVPFAVIGSNTVVEARGQRVRGRLYPWGIVEGKKHSVEVNPDYSGGVIGTCTVAE